MTYWNFILKNRQYEFSNHVLLGKEFQRNCWKRARLRALIAGPLLGKMQLILNIFDTEPRAGSLLNYGLPAKYETAQL